MFPKRFTALCMLCALLLAGCGSGDAPSSVTQETRAPETQSETEAPETQPETEAPETQPETALPEPPDPETAPFTIEHPTDATTDPELPETEAPQELTEAPEEFPTQIVDTPDRPVELNIEPGIWIATGGPDGDRYFDFGTGAFLYQDSGMGLGFSLEMGEDPAHLVFHFGDIENNTPAAIYWDSAHSFVLEWKDGTTERLTWWSDETLADFTFYSNDELCEMALGYYEMQTGYRPSQAAAQIDENGAVAIQLYDELDGHNSTSDWYTVDRFTALGTDLTGNEIDLKKAPRG